MDLQKIQTFPPFLHITFAVLVALSAGLFALMSFLTIQHMLPPVWIVCIVSMLSIIQLVAELTHVLLLGGMVGTLIISEYVKVIVAHTSVFHTSLSPQ